MHTLHPGVAARVDFWTAAALKFDYGNNIPQMALREGLKDAFGFPGILLAFMPRVVSCGDQPGPPGSPARAA